MKRTMTAKRVPLTQEVKFYWILYSRRGVRNVRRYISRHEQTNRIFNSIEKFILHFRRYSAAILRKAFRDTQIRRLFNGFRKTFYYWFIPALTALLLFMIVSPVLAQLPDRNARLTHYVYDNDLETGIETIDGYSQTYYVFEGEKTFVSSGNYNVKQVDTSGEYITWSVEYPGEAQIFLHHATSGTTIQLTRSGVNLSPKVNSKGDVVWEQWDGNTWQLALYNGETIASVTSGDLAAHADIEGDYIVFARKSGSGLWRSEAYSIKDNKKLDLSFGEPAEYPRIKNREVYVGAPLKEQTKFPLTIEDMFTLNIKPLETDSSSEVTYEDILKELEGLENTATESAKTKTTFIPRP